MDIIQSANPLLLSFFPSSLKRDLTVFRLELFRKCFHSSLQREVYFFNLWKIFFYSFPTNNIHTYNVSDMSIVILKNLIFNENEIKAGRILTFFPTKTIQVGELFVIFGKHANDDESITS